MKRIVISVSTAVALAILLLGGWCQPATAAAAFPEKGKSIDIIVPYAAGGSADVSARILASGLEKELGTPVRVANRPGAGAQIGTSELARAKKDGYTMGMTLLPQMIVIYLDPDRKADFSRKSFQPLAGMTADPHHIVVKADSPYKTMKDLIDGAKANPGKIKIGLSGIYTSEHLAMVKLQKLTGVKFALVQFDGISSSRAALLGGHIDVIPSTIPGLGGVFKSPEIRLLGVLDNEPSSFAPDVKTLKSQGYDVNSVVTFAVSLPAGIPKEVLDILATATKKALETDEYKKKALAVRASPRYMGPDEFGAYWDQKEAEVKPLLDLARQQQ
jgi:tripartite-type tricarboxylate transporter receptor subunit TctC